MKKLILIILLISCQRSANDEFGMPIGAFMLNKKAITNPIGFASNLTFRVFNIKDGDAIGLYYDNRCLFPIFEETPSSGIKDFELSIMDGYNRVYIKAVNNNTISCSNEYLYVRPVVTFDYIPMVNRIELSWSLDVPMIETKYFIQLNNKVLHEAPDYNYIFTGLDPGTYPIHLYITDPSGFQRKWDIEVEVL